MSRMTLALVVALPLLAFQPGVAQLAPDQAKIAAVTAGTLKEARASWWGFDPEDSTAQLQAAINSGVPKLIVDKMPGPWIVTPISLVSNQEIIFEEGVEVIAKRGEFKAKGATLFTAANRENITLRGYGATWRMWREDYDNPQLYEKAEWRHCLSIRSSSNITVLGLTLTDSGGDGIYLGTATAGVTNRNIIIRDVTCDRNYRQGISVITAENLLIENCRLTNTNGTPPRAGIDFEPNLPGERLVNCVMRNCHIENNAGNGIVMYLRPLNATSEPVSLRFENCHCIGDRGSTALILGGTPEAAVDGKVEFVDCIFEDSIGPAIAVSKPAAVCPTRFVNCSIINPAPDQPALSPIQLVSSRDATVPAGGVEFADVLVNDPLQRTPISYINGAGVDLEDISGTLIIQKGEQRERVPLTRELLAEWIPIMRWKKIPRLSLEGLALQPLVPDAPAERFPLPHARVRSFGSFLLWAQQGDQVRITFDYSQVGQYSGDPMEVVITAPSGAEAHRARAAFQEKTEVTFTAPETGVYRMSANPGRNRMAITSTTHRINLNGEKEAVHLMHGAGDYWFWVPQGTTEFGVRVAGEGSGEGIAAQLINPAGEVVDQVDNIAGAYQFEVQQPADTPGQAWLLRLSRPSGMTWEDHYVDLRGLPPVLAPSREALLVPAH